jgi:hypothetical protein
MDRHQNVRGRSPSLNETSLPEADGMVHRYDLAKGFPLVKLLMTLAHQA